MKNVNGDLYGIKVEVEKFAEIRMSNIVKIVDIARSFLKFLSWILKLRT